MEKPHLVVLKTKHANAKLEHRKNPSPELAKVVEVLEHQIVEEEKSAGITSAKSHPKKSS